MKSSPREIGGRPSYPNTLPEPRRATGAIYAADEVLIFGNHFWGVLMILHLQKFVYSFFLVIKRRCRRPYVKIGLRKKVTALWNQRFWRVTRVLSNSRVPTGIPTGKFPLILGHLELSDFEKWGLFGKLTSWTRWGDRNSGPHPTGIKFIIYIWIESDFSSIKGKNLRNWKLWWGFATPKY